MNLPNELFFYEDNACIYEIHKSDGYIAEILVASFNKTDYGRRLMRVLVDLYNNSRKC